MGKRFACSFSHPTGDENNVLQAKKESTTFPPKSSLLVERIDGDLVVEWQRADVRKRALRSEEHREGKCCSIYRKSGKENYGENKKIYR